MASANNNPEEAKYVGIRKTTSADTSVGLLGQRAKNTEENVDEDTNTEETPETDAETNAGANKANKTNNTNTEATNSESSGFNITAAAAQIDWKHEQERLAAEAEQKKKDEEAKARAEEMQKKWNADDALTGLEEVDWSVGEEAFLKEWTRRIDAYLKGTVLSGYGSTFARAAWENGVDPRWSPAISNTESGNGSACFLPHNAWGWGQSSWSSWEEAINAHIAGLARGYGYSITWANAEKYCPPNTEFWFNNTLNQMKKI